MAHRVIDTYPRETVDFLPLTGLWANGHQVTDTAGFRTADDPVQVCVVGEHARPTTWASVDVDVTTRVGVRLDGPLLGPGVFKVYVRVGTAVIDAGTFRLT